MTYFVGRAALGAILVGALVWSQSTEAKAAGLFPYQNANVVARGEVVYQENCASCHGDQLQGEVNWRERDGEGYLPAPPHDASGHTWHHTDEQLLAITRQGTAALVGNGYRSRMQGFADELTEADLLAVLAYIKSTWPVEIINRHNEINKQAEY